MRPEAVHDQVVADVRKNRREVIRVAMRPNHIGPLVVLSTLVKTDHDTVQAPPRQSIAFRVGYLDDLIEALQQARRLAWEKGAIA